jgi:hypothetical protein
MIKTVRLTVGKELQLFKLEKKSLKERKEAMKYVTNLQEVAKSLLTCTAELTPTAPVVVSFPDRGLEDLHDAMDWDTFEEIQNESIGSFPLHDVSGPHVFPTNESVTKFQSPLCTYRTSNDF